MKEAMQDVVREKLESVRAELEGPGDTATEKQLDSPISVTPTRTGIHRFGPCVLAEVKNEIKVLIWIRPREKEVRPPYPEGFSLDILIYFGQVVGISWGYEPSWFFWDAF